MFDNIKKMTSIVCILVFLSYSPPVYAVGPADNIQLAAILASLVKELQVLKGLLRFGQSTARGVNEGARFIAAGYKEIRNISGMTWKDIQDEALLGMCQGNAELCSIYTDISEIKDQISLFQEEDGFNKYVNFNSHLDSESSRLVKKIGHLGYTTSVYCTLFQSDCKRLAYKNDGGIVSAAETILAREKMKISYRKLRERGKTNAFIYTLMDDTLDDLSAVDTVEMKAERTKQLILLENMQNIQEQTDLQRTTTANQVLKDLKEKELDTYVRNRECMWQLAFSGKKEGEIICKRLGVDIYETKFKDTLHLSSQQSKPENGK